MGSNPVEPLEDRAYFSISTTEEGYVRIEQSMGDPPIYTPAEVRSLADDLVAAADEADSTID